MTAIYGNLFTHKFGLKDSGVWLDTLKDLTPKALESALERLMRLSNNHKFTEFPPNCLEFRKLCIDYHDTLRLPKVDDAFQEIRMAYQYRTHVFSHPVVRYTAYRLGDLIESDVLMDYKRFKTIFEHVCMLVKQGHAVPNIDDRRTIIDINKEVGRAHLASIKQLLGVTS